MVVIAGSPLKSLLTWWYWDGSEQKNYIRFQREAMWAVEGCTDIVKIN